MKGFAHPDIITVYSQRWVTYSTKTAFELSFTSVSVPPTLQFLTILDVTMINPAKTITFGNKPALSDGMHLICYSLWEWKDDLTLFFSPLNMSWGIILAVIFCCWKLTVYCGCRCRMAKLLCHKWLVIMYTLWALFALAISSMSGIEKPCFGML